MANVKSKYRLGCCIPGGSFMPEGVREVAPTAFNILREGAGIILKNGFGFCECSVGMIMKLTEVELSLLAAAGLPIEVCNSFIPFDPEYRICSDGSLESGSPLRRYVCEAMRRMSRLGIKIVVFGSGGARRIPDGMSRKDGLSRISDFLAFCAEVGEKYGITTAIEPLRALECNAINTTATAAAMMRTLSHPRIAYLADAFHMACEGEAPGAIIENGVLPVHIHVSEAPDRTYPGSHGGEDLKAFATGLKKTDYAGRISVECGFSDFEKEVALAYEFVSKTF